MIPEALKAHRGSLEGLTKAQAQVVKREGDHLALVRVLAGPLMWVDLRDTSLCHWLAVDGYWEAWVTLPILRYVKPGMVCVDVGANVGYYTILMAAQGARVMALEPNPYLVGLLAGSVEENGYGDLVTIHRMAVGDRAADVTLRVPPEHWGGATILDMPCFDAGGAPSDAWGSFATKMVPLSDLVERADFVKVDVEGSEVAVWDGMKDLLARSPKIRVAMEVANGREYELIPFVSRIKSEGYEVFVVQQNGDLAPATPDVFEGDPGRGSWAMLWIRPHLL